jgi:type IV secretion system protein VirB8
MANLPQRPPESTHKIHPTTEDYVEIADKVRTGEYFREARKMFDVSVHDPMSERYMYLFITAISLLVFFIAFTAVQSLYPLNSQVPLIFYANDVIEDIPRIQKLQVTKDENPGEALLRFMVKRYLEAREGYDIATFDRDVNGVKSQSNEDVSREFQAFINPRNPEGPINQYQRHSRRYINIVYSKRLPDSMEVIFDATVESKVAVKISRWRANIAFKYSGIELDEKGEKVKPVTFIVTKYHSKRLQDAQ